MRSRFTRLAQNMVQMVDVPDKYLRRTWNRHSYPRAISEL